MRSGHRCALVGDDRTKEIRWREADITSLRLSKKKLRQTLYRKTINGILWGRMRWEYMRINGNVHLKLWRGHTLKGGGRRKCGVIQSHTSYTEEQTQACCEPEIRNEKKNSWLANRLIRGFVIEQRDTKPNFPHCKRRHRNPIHAEEPDIPLVTLRNLFPPLDNKTNRRTSLALAETRF